MNDYVGRLAPSPTGALHLGNVRTFMIAWLRARSQGGRVIMRMEDLDHPKDKPGAAAQAIEDLKWLGFDWDEEYVQSERKPIYAAATKALHEAGLIYPCVCSRKDVEAAQSAPHAGDQLFYPGTCRDRFATWSEALAFRNRETSHASHISLPCWRFCVPAGRVVSFTDAFAGSYAQDVAATLGDFPLARDEGGAGYTLAATLDDLLMGVTEVVRGDDLLSATPAQILLAEALRGLGFGGPSAGGVACGDAGFGGPSAGGVACGDAGFGDQSAGGVACGDAGAIAYCHVPLVVGPDGRRLAKRHGDTRIAAYREAGYASGEILGHLAAACGWCERGERPALAELLPRFTLATVPRAPFVELANEGNDRIRGMIGMIE